jgi:hypothetical protein
MKNRNMLKAIVKALDTFKEAKVHVQRKVKGKRSAIVIDETVPLPTRRLEVEDIELQ